MHSYRRLAGCLIIAAVSAAVTMRAADALEPPHYQIQLRVNPDDRTISVRERITLSGRRSITISVADWIPIRNVRIDGTPVKDEASKTSVTLTLPSLGKHRIDLTANGVVPALAPDAARQTPGSDAVAGRQGAYLPNWARWHPQVADVAATYRLFIVTPAAYRAAATGALRSETLGASDNAAVFVSRTLSEPPSVFIGPYTVTERKSGGLRIRTYFHDSAVGLAESYLDAADRYIRMFERRIGAYPFTDFDIVSAPLPVGLGFPNLTYVDQHILRLPFMRRRSLAHEVLHNWWGNGVWVDYETGNWAEGLTTFMADLALAERRSAKAGIEMRLGWLRDYAALPKERDTPVTKFVAKRHDASQVVGYGKVAFIFNMLEQEVGPERFSAAIKQFWNSHKFATASWSDIRSAFEATTKRDLGWFFRQWTERAGAPQLTLEDARSRRRGKGYLLEVALAQTAPTYQLKVPVRVTTAVGQRHFDIRLESKSVRVQLQLDAKPVSVEIDPDHMLFRHLLPGEAPPILRDILLDNSAETLVLYADPVRQKLARELARRLFDTKPNFIASDQIPKMPNAHLLVMGSTEQINRFISSSELPARPTKIAGHGSGRAWTARKPGGNAVLFVEADDPEALSAMMRPLPHYRSKSYIVFEEDRAVANGVWLTADGPMMMTLD